MTLCLAGAPDGRRRTIVLYGWLIETDVLIGLPVRKRWARSSVG